MAAPSTYAKMIHKVSLVPVLANGDQGRDPSRRSAGVGQATMVARTDRRGSATVCRLKRQRMPAATPADQTGWSMGSHRQPEEAGPDHWTAQLAEVVEAGPVPAVDGVVRDSNKDLRSSLETFARSRSTRPRSGRVEGARLRQGIWRGRAPQNELVSLFEAQLGLRRFRRLPPGTLRPPCRRPATLCCRGLRRRGRPGWREIFRPGQS